MTLDRSFPTQTLLFFVTNDITNEIRAEVATLVANLAVSREWVIGPPRFVNEVEELDEAERRDGDVPFETVGGVLVIYSAMPPTALPREIDLQHLEEVSVLLEAVRDFSREKSVAFEFEFDDECIGTVIDGEMGNGLEDGLLDEWRRYLGVSPE
jgi:hypothetical protein